MISSSHRFIYLHAPKTGGNSIQTLLLPLSDDKKIFGGQRDGFDRFEVKGSITDQKHARLSDYAEKLGDKLLDYATLISVRHPLNRAVSFYFSPHRWIRQLPGRSGKGAYAAGEVFWSLEDFERSIKEMSPMVDFLKIGDKPKQPDFVIRFEAINDDFKRCVEALGLSAHVAELPHVNKSIAPDLVGQALANHDVKRLVEEHFSEDFDFFGY